MRVVLRRGISPIVATIILIIIAMVASYVVWNMVQNTSKPRTIVRLDVVTGTATISPTGSECIVRLTLRNSGTVKVGIEKIVVSYNGKEETFVPGTNATGPKSILSRGTAEYEIDASASGFGGQFKDGDTIKVTVYYTDPQGNEYSVTKFLEMHM